MILEDLKNLSAVADAGGGEIHVIPITEKIINEAVDWDDDTGHGEATIHSWLMNQGTFKKLTFADSAKEFNEKTGMRKRHFQQQLERPSAKEVSENHIKQGKVFVTFKYATPIAAFDKKGGEKLKNVYFIDIDDSWTDRDIPD